jgi:hypothetical protein
MQQTQATFQKSTKSQHNVDKKDACAYVCDCTKQRQYAHLQAVCLIYILALQVLGLQMAGQERFGAV